MLERRKKQLQITVIKGATKTSTGHFKRKKLLCVEKISHFSFQNVNKKIATQ